MIKLFGRNSNNTNKIRQELLTFVRKFYISLNFVLKDQSKVTYDFYEIVTFLSVWIKANPDADLLDESNVNKAVSDFLKS